jgi:mycoredoxin-dependent peroxiredoxin
MAMAVEVGQEAPDLTLRDENGEEVELSSLRGRNVVLIFFPAAFSGICTKELHTATDLAEKYGAAGAEVFGVSVDSPYALKAFKRDEDLDVRFLSDFHPKGQMATEYEAYIPEAGVATRATYVIDKDGKVAYKAINHPGEMRDQDAIIDALAACPI